MKVQKTVSVENALPPGAEKVDYAQIQDQREVRNQIVAENAQRQQFAGPEELSPLQALMQPPKRENVKDISFELPDGRVIEMAPPRVGTAFLIAKILESEQGMNPLNVSQLIGNVKAALYVQAIDGEVIERPTNKTEMQVLMNKLGDVGCDFVGMVFANYFAPPGPAELKIIKKS